MTMITLDHTISVEAELLDSTRRVLRELREDIDELREKLADGDAKEATGASSDINRLKSLFSTCLETENRLAKCRELKAGIAQNGVAFDFEAARHSIGRKLDRLRAES